MTEQGKPAIGNHRHFKGNHYIVVGYALHTETQETMVLYQRAANTVGPNTLWARPLSSWNEPTPDGQVRFQRVGK